MKTRDVVGWTVGAAAGWMVFAAVAAEERASVTLPEQVQNITLANGDSVQVKTGVKVDVVERKADAPKPARKTAIIVDNRAGAQLNDAVLRFEDQVAARVAGDAFEIISKEDVAQALKRYPVNGGATAQTLAGAERNALGTEADRTLADGTTALRLAQNIGADYLLMVALDSFNAETRRYKANEIDVQNRVFTLRGTYKLLDGVSGGTLGGLPLRASKPVRESANLTVEDTDVTAELIEKLADQVAQDLLKKKDVFREKSVIGDVPVTLRCAMRDLQGNELSLTDLGMSEDNLVVKGTNALLVQAVAEVAVDGLVMGSTPATLKIKPGLHTLRLTRAGCDTAEMTIKADAGMDLTVTMQLNADGFARWVSIRNALNAIDVSRKLTDAEAEKLRGAAQMLRQSGFLVEQKSATDVKTDVKIDAKKVPEINVYRSLF